MIPTIFVLTAVGAWAAFKIIKLTVDNRDLRAENEFLKRNTK